MQADIDRVLRSIRSSASSADIRHVKTFLRVSRLIAVCGCVVGARSFNLVAPLLLAIAQIGRWGIAHQVLHCSYDSIPRCPVWLRGSRFARGWRRYWDWCDWILPEAWQHEHNIHHVNTGGPGDPDIVEANLDFLRLSPMPRWQKRLAAILIMATWRFSYFAPSTLIQLRCKERGLPAARYRITGVTMFLPMFSPFREDGRDFWKRCLLPYGLFQFVLIPFLFVPEGLPAVRNLFLAQLVAEVIINVYGWALLSSSHTASDLHRFNHVPRNKAEWYLHQVLGTANYSRGSSWTGWSQAWVNYQIEHHLCPNLTLLQLERMSPEIERVCRRHGVPYTAEWLPKRFCKMFAVITGELSMPQRETCEPAV